MVGNIEHTAFNVSVFFENVNYGGQNIVGIEDCVVVSVCYLPAGTVLQVGGVAGREKTSEPVGIAFVVGGAVASHYVQHDNRVLRQILYFLFQTVEQDFIMTVAAETFRLLVALSYLVGRLLAARSIKYIEIMYQKQKQFVSDAAHELRTPLSILLSYTELLEYKPRKKEIIGDIKKQILQLNDLIDSLLAIARYDNEKVVLRKEKFDAGRLASDCAQSISHLCSGKPIEVSAQKAELYADQGMVRQLMYILLDNALKYTPDEKKIAITVATDGKRVKISVTDNGIGINAHDLPHIFERFWRADQARNAKGLGLGLCLAKMIVELHGGRIDVKSAVGAGSTFEVFLPR